MNDRTKKKKFIALESRELLARNVSYRMEKEFSRVSNKPEALAKRIGTSKSTVQRVLTGEIGVTLDVLAQLAMGLRCHPFELLQEPPLEAKRP